MWRMAKSFFDGARAGAVCYFKARPSRFAYSISCWLSMFFIRSTSPLRNPAVRILFPVTRRKHFPFLTYVWHAIDQAKRVEESAVVRRALRPVEFFGLVDKLRADTDVERRVLELSSSLKRKLSNEILQRLRVLGDGANLIELREVLGSWLAEKLKALKQGLPISNAESSMVAKEAKLITDALESDRVKLLEDIGLWIPSAVNNYEIDEIDDRPENATEDEENTVPAPPLSSQCRAEPHTDYDGAAIRWDLTHHKETAADCCQACIDQAKNAKVGQIKCNIWVYCPSEFGCYSPDIYEHWYQECWLKHAKKPRLNFKDKYSETYRNSHPTAPVAVPWISGVISS